ncbi:MAG TPA: sporulation protein [Planococcus sp. (in: firmicutes)]|nr:sporulation protein [Planococcus sp. (in: firmicutes)]
MKFKDFLSTIGLGSMKIETVIERPHLNEGETLNGTIYVEGDSVDHEIDYIELRVIKMVEDYREDSDFDYIEDTIAKTSIELIGSVKSKESRMFNFEIVPDERWQVTTPKTKLVLRTILHVKNGRNAKDEDEITYGTYE